MKISNDLETVLIPISQTALPQEEGERSQSEGMHGCSFEELAVRPGSVWGHCENLLITQPY